MGNYLNIGNAGFKAVRKGLYVDKSGMIAFINESLGTMDKLTCVSRPRRFGKSFAAKMLCAYYDKSCDSKELFEDLEIAKAPSFEAHLNQYDVIYLDITWFISNAADIRDTVQDLQAEVVKELTEAYPQAPEASTLPKALSNVAQATGQKFIVIIDEWDALFREARQDTALQEEYIQLLRGMFKSSGQTDKMIEAAYMTGILPIKKYGTESALTDFREYTMATPRKLAEYVGFTEREVRRLCEEHQMDFAEARHWYDGYSFPQMESVYSPNSVMEAVKNREFGTYWTESGTYESLKLYIDMDEDGLKEAIVQMLGGAHCPIDIGTFQNDMTSIRRRDDVLTLLVYLGYLAYRAKDRTVSIPNEEVRQEFVRAVTVGRHREVANLILTSDHLLQETLQLNGEAVAAAIEKAHNAGTAPLFYNDEQALRSVIRFAYISCIDEFLRIDELPSGKGYADVVYLPKKGSNMPILVIELKWNKSAGSAIEQIRSRNYPQVLEGFGSEILLVGISYQVRSKRHVCVIERHWRE